MKFEEFLKIPQTVNMTLWTYQLVNYYAHVMSGIVLEQNVQSWNSLLVIVALSGPLGKLWKLGFPAWWFWWWVSGCVFSCGFVITGQNCTVMHLVSDRHLKVWHDPQHSGRLSPGCWQVLCDQSGFVGFCRFLSFFFMMFVSTLCRQKTIFQESTWHLWTSLHTTNPSCTASV